MMGPEGVEAGGGSLGLGLTSEQEAELLPMMVTPFLMDIFLDAMFPEQEDRASIDDGEGI